jgi:hypothetical protein
MLIGICQPSINGTSLPEALQGILILDDYWHYQGARRGVDEYLSKLDKKLLLQRIDYSCRLAVKPTA